LSKSKHSEDKKYTYADYITWTEEERWEIIDGKPYMQVTSTWQHQAISREILAQFNNYLKATNCHIFASPFDLRIPQSNEKDEETTFVCQPDLLVICDKEELKGTGYYGTPTMIIEITSPSTAKIDKLLKFNKYEKAGVMEYWIIEPGTKLVSVFTLQGNKRYGRPDLYSDEDKIKVNTFPDLIIDLKPVFNNL
jgi:Uma2 family endonuclease